MTYLATKLVTSGILLSCPHLALQGLVSRLTTNVSLPREPSTIFLSLVAQLSSLVGMEARPLGYRLMRRMFLGLGTRYLLTTPLQLLMPPVECQSITGQYLVASRARIICVVVPFCLFSQLV